MENQQNQSGQQQGSDENQTNRNHNQGNQQAQQAGQNQSQQGAEPNRGSGNQSGRGAGNGGIGTGEYEGTDQNNETPQRDSYTQEERTSRL